MADITEVIEVTQVTRTINYIVVIIIQHLYIRHVLLFVDRLHKWLLKFNYISYLVFIVTHPAIIYKHVEQRQQICI